MTNQQCIPVKKNAGDMIFEELVARVILRGPTPVNNSNKA